MKSEPGGRLVEEPNQDDSSFGDRIRETVTGISGYDCYVSCGFHCSYCGEWNVTEVDESAGTLQRYVEDCQVCCQPNVLIACFDRQEERLMVRAQRKS